jgi:hypothetical protein
MNSCSLRPSGKVGAYAFSLIRFNGAGMGLAGHANCFKRIQNRTALHFQFACQIVDSYFAHPSLFLGIPETFLCAA